MTDSLKGPYPHTRSFHTNAYLDSAGELGLHFEVISFQDSLCRIRNSTKSLLVHGSALSCNNIVSSSAAAHKHIAHLLLSHSGAPVPAQQYFTSRAGFKIEQELDEIFDFADANYPVVVKPDRDSEGRYVYTNVRSEDELAVALSNILAHRQYGLLVEAYIPGRVYRVLACRGEIVDVVERMPPAVTGTGSHNIRELVSFDNASRELYDLPPILLNRRTLFHLGQKGMSRDSVPRAGQRVEISPTVNVSQGAETCVVPMASIPVGTRTMLVSAVDACGLELAGIDFISPDITSGDPDVRHAVLEVNSCPALRGHVYAGRNYDLRAPSRVLELLLG